MAFPSFFADMIIESVSPRPDIEPCSPPPAVGWPRSPRRILAMDLRGALLTEAVRKALDDEKLFSGAK